MGDLMTKVLFWQYVVISAAYLYGGHGWKGLYFIGAAIITISIIRMDG